MLHCLQDLKKYHFYYWFAFLAPKTPTVHVVQSPQPLSEDFNEKQVKHIFLQQRN